MTTVDKSEYLTARQRIARVRVAALKEVAELGPSVAPSFIERINADIESRLADQEAVFVETTLVAADERSDGMGIEKLSNAELEIAARLLDMAKDEFSNHGCTDFHLPNTDENWSLILAMEARNKTAPEDIPKRPPSSKPIYTQDWLLMAYFAARLRGKA